MTNYLAIATVTGAIKKLLDEEMMNDKLFIFQKLQASSASPNPTVIQLQPVSTKPPDIETSQPADNRLNIFLYQVTPNLGYKNLDLPTRSQAGELIARPR